MGELSREEKIGDELNEVLTGILMEVFAGVTSKEDGLSVLNEMRSIIYVAIKAIDRTIESIDVKN